MRASRHRRRLSRRRRFTRPPHARGAPLRVGSCSKCKSESGFLRFSSILRTVRSVAPSSDAASSPLCPPAHRGPPPAPPRLRSGAHPHSTPALYVCVHCVRSRARTTVERLEILVTQFKDRRPGARPAAARLGLRRAPRGGADAPMPDRAMARLIPLRTRGRLVPGRGTDLSAVRKNSVQVRGQR